MPMFETDYVFSEEFRKWLAAYKPDSLRVLNMHNVTRAKLTVVLDDLCQPYRFRLLFLGIDSKLSQEFDRMRENESACMVLSEHPDRLNEPVFRRTSDGLLVSADYLSRLLKTHSVYVPVRVTQREACMAKIQLPDGSEATLDVDEVVTWYGVDSDLLVPDKRE